MSDPLELHKAYVRLFDCPDGQTVMKDLETRGCFRHSTFSMEPGRIQFQEGRRSIVLHIKHMLDATNFARTEDNHE